MFTFKILLPFWLLLICSMPLIIALQDLEHKRLTNKVSREENKARNSFDVSMRAQQRANNSRFGITRAFHNAFSQNRWKSYERHNSAAQRNQADLASHSYRTKRFDTPTVWRK
ncbi:uncharacterized protein FA14DRAFT_177458 [Meira miltonrushii]|uniref:Uncharacterized protein n=1 Tax=Meira miltonrushii TaxID=1280837 RepID=A0A316VKQ7_9BASI|nr:uncharacterized protein FA14DRAFT_177458 [Meira miltonrushii]PWN38182.1 hypothetical protein FA14DRAFT_177458 [Meira miltonrushii]